MAERQISFERGRATTFEIGVAASTTGAAITGKAKADFNISKDGAAFAALNASSTVTEIANGFYKVVLDATTDATCDRFVLAYITAGGAVCAVFGQSQWEFSKVRIESSVSTANGNNNPTDAPLFVKNTYASSNGCAAVMFEFAGANNQANGLYLANYSGWGNCLGMNNSAIGISMACMKGIDQTWGTTFLSISGSPGASGGKLVTWQTLGGTAPTGPIIDFGASMSVAQLIDWTSTPAASAPVARISSGGAGPVLELKNTSTGPALKINNTSSGDGVTISAAGAGTALKVSNSSTGDASLFTAGGAGTGLKISNTSTGDALGVTAGGAGTAAKITNTSTGDALSTAASGAGTALKVSNSSTGDGALFTAGGAGTGLKVTNTSTGIAANIASSGAGDALKINNSSTGNAIEVVAAGAGIGLLVNNSSTGDAVKFIAAGAAAYALNLDMGTAGAFAMRCDAAGWPETTGALTGLDFFGAMGRLLADQFNVHTLNKDTQVQTTTKRDGVTSLHTRTVADDGTTQTVGGVA